MGVLWGILIASALLGLIYQFKRRSALKDAAGLLQWEGTIHAQRLAPIADDWGKAPGLLYAQDDRLVFRAYENPEFTSLFIARIGDQPDTGWSERTLIGTVNRSRIVLQFPEEAGPFLRRVREKFSEGTAT